MNYFFHLSFLLCLHTTIEFALTAAFASAWAEAGNATVAAATTEGEVVQLRALDLAQARASALRLVAAKGLPLARLETRAASLEDVFVRLVGGTS